MLLKFGVDISRLKRPIRRALRLIDNVFQRDGFGEAVITSTYEGLHSPSSLHYCDLAIDIRKPKEADIINLKDLQADLIEILGKNFDVILEATHFHIEYDPK